MIVVTRVAVLIKANAEVYLEPSQTSMKELFYENC